LGGPNTDTFYRYELGYHFVVRQPVEVVENGGVLYEMLRQVVDVAGFAAGEAEGAEVVRGEGEDFVRIETGGVLDAL